MKPAAKPLGFVRWSIGACLVAAVVAAVVGGLLAGVAGATGAGLGPLVVVVFYGMSVAAIAWADSHARQLVLVVGLATYLAKIGVLASLLVLVQLGTWSRALGWGIVAGIVAWVLTHIVWLARARWYSVDLPDSNNL